MIVNLRKYYRAISSVTYCEVSDQVKALLDEHLRYEHSQKERRRYHRDFAACLDSYSFSHNAEVPSSEETYFKLLALKELRLALHQLPVIQRRRIYAHFFMGLHLTQIARIEKVSVTAVSASIKQGIANLKKCLND